MKRKKGREGVGIALDLIVGVRSRIWKERSNGTRVYCSERPGSTVFVR